MKILGHGTVLLKRFQSAAEIRFFIYWTWVGGFGIKCLLLYVISGFKEFLAELSYKKLTHISFEALQK